MDISVVIPTCNRKESLFRVLKCLEQSTHPVQEIIVVDSSDVKLYEQELSGFNKIKITYLTSNKSVCVQRNAGINHASSEWIFLCDDDLEVPADYLTGLVNHLQNYQNSGAVSGLFLQQENGQWEWQYPVGSTLKLLWRFIFQLSMWGEIKGSNVISRPIKNFYAGKGNHVSKAGWPTITEVSGDYFTTSIYTLGASLIKKEWLLASPFDETLSSHGIGDNYGVALGFPQKIHVLKDVKVYHHREPGNRLNKTDQYFQRVMALHYFLKTKAINGTHPGWLVWSLIGNATGFLLLGKFSLLNVSAKAIIMIVTGRNPLLKNYNNGAS